MRTVFFFTLFVSIVVAHVLSSKEEAGSVETDRNVGGGTHVEQEDGTIPIDLKSKWSGKSSRSAGEIVGNGRRTEDVLGSCETECIQESITCHDASNEDVHEEKKCQVYKFDCLFLCKDVSSWTCEDHCINMFDYCSVVEEVNDCVARKERCINCCPEEPTGSPVTDAPQTNSPTTSPTKYPTLSPTILSTSAPSKTSSPTTEGDFAAIGVPIYPNTEGSLKKIFLPESRAGMLLKLNKVVDETCKDATSAPFPVPTGAPTEAPTAFPTSSPTTPLPTLLPTAFPTSSPTTALPTKPPTAAPTTSPITIPPTKSPTAYPTRSPALIPTVSPTPSPTTTSPTPSPSTAMPVAGVEYELLDGTFYDECPSGQEVPQEDCLAAAKSVSQDITTITNTQDGPFVHDWGGLPCGCFIYNNYLIDYDFNCGNKGTNPASKLVCKKNVNAPTPTPVTSNGNDYILLDNTYDKCPSGQEVPQEDCLAAANSVSQDITTITNRQDGPFVHDWGGLPCGCFIYNDSLIDYDFNCGNKGTNLASKLVCKQNANAPTPTPVTSNGNDYILLDNTYDKCPSGQEVPQGDCLAAANSVSQDITTITNRENGPFVLDWSGYPCGCFIFNNQLIDYHTNCNVKAAQVYSRPVCKMNAARRRILNSEDYVLLDGTSYDKCPSGQEVPQEDCLAAAKSVSQDITTITNRQDGPLVYDWPGLPCGCFIYNDQLIDYDFNCDNKAPNPSSKLVCLDPGSVTGSPTSAPTPAPPVLIPAGRSYDEKNWESTHPLLLPYFCDENKKCSVELPPEECPGIHYIVEKFEPETLSPEREAARLLIQTTFGPTRESLSDVVQNYSSTSEWVKDQMDEATTPISSHREHYRKRSNSHVRQGLEKFGLRNACESGSRWNRWAFNRYRDFGKQIILQPTSSSSYLMLVDGIPRTEVDSADFHSSLGQSTFFNSQGPFYICRGSSDFSSLPGAILTLANALTDCDNSNMVGRIPMPAVDFFPSTDLSNLSIPTVVLEELDPLVLDVKLLSTDMVPCILKKSWPNFVKDVASGHYYVEDRRVEFLEMDPASISGMGLSTKTCPSAPKTFLNEDTCIIRSDCSPPLYQPSTGMVKLDAINIRKFYEIGGQYIYRLSGMPIIKDPLNRYEMFSPCNDAITYKRFDWDPFRFVRKNAPGQACQSPTFLSTSIQSALSQAIAAELALLDSSVRFEKLVLDLVIPKNTCNDPSKTAMGASINVFDPGTGTTTCWTHSHPDEWSVFNFDQWTMFHPGNLEAYFNHKKNPIAAFAEQDTSSGNLEDRVTLVMPGWHPDERFQDSKRLFDHIGNWGDTIAFNDLPPSVQGTEMASEFGAILSPNAVADFIEVCASPNEVSNDPTKGHQYRLQKGGDTGEMGTESLDQDGYGWNQKNRVWNTISTFGTDQLRQRVAWVLSSIFVVTAIDINMEHSVESWSSYHDIFVRNAFGNYFNIMKEVSFHPLMSTMLTYHKSRSMSYNFEKEGIMLFPDENYAREIMQLFSIGLYKLNQDGTKVIDESTGEPAETYTNEDIMTFARAWTNFQRRPYRANLEVYSDLYFSDNWVDPLMLPTTDGRDVFPKLGLDDGGRVYIGDKVKRCDAKPPKSWLRTGAKYIFRGSNPNLELGRKDPESWDNYPDDNRVILDSNSDLHSKLCNADPVTGACRFESTVILTENIECFGECFAGESNDNPATGTTPCDCSIDEPRTVRVDDHSSINGNPPSVWYEYVQDPCVQMAFPESGHMKAVSEIGKWWGSYGNEAMCADTRLAIAGTTCCDPNLTNPRNLCLFRGERTTYETAKNRCEEKGLVTCAWEQVPISIWCGSDIEWGGDHEATGMRFSWTNEDCSMKVQIDGNGYVAMVHDVGSLIQNIKGRVRVDVGTYFRVIWNGGVFPKDDNCNAIPGCEDRGSTCLCNTMVQTELVFGGTRMPTKAAVLSELHIGASDPALFDGIYNVCTAPACAAASSDFKLYLTQVVDNDNDLIHVFDEAAIFEVSDDITGETMFLSNTKSIVNIGSFSFRNPPMFNSPVDQTQRDALYETDAVLQHYARHSNTPPFVAMRLIQHLVTSNPSPRYVSVVAEAFRTGIYGDFGSRAYGDLEAAVAAVVLDDEARSATLDADGTNGRAREPLLKLLHIFRSMELGTVDGRDREVDLEFMKDKIGQESHYAPSVFSFFLPEYQPVGPVLDMGLVAPETQLFDAPNLIGFVNGLVSLSFYGIQDCEDGKNFGSRLGRYKIPDHPDGGYFQCHESAQIPHRLRWAPSSNASPEEIVREMDLLLTGGRLSSYNEAIIAQAYSSKSDEENNAVALQYALSHFSFTPEFHITNHLFSGYTQVREERTLTVPSVPVNPPPVTDYKAIVYVYLQGGLDSYSLLMPHTCTGDLNNMYHQVRGNIAINNNMQLQINDFTGSQPCTTFGVHPEMTLLQQLYNNGEASFIANVGPLIEPIANSIEFDQGKPVPPSLFAHNIQTGETQGVATGDASAGGVLGRIGDAMNKQAGEEIFDAYSISGTPKALEGSPGLSRPADVLTPVGVSTFTFSASGLETTMQELNKRVSNSIYGETFSDAITTAIARKNLLDGAIGTSALSSSTEACFQGLSTLETTIALQMKQVARIINQRNSLQSKRDVFYVELGSFDSHGDAYYNIALKLSDLNDALNCFVNDMKSQSLWNSVTVMSASEFGRTLTSNGMGTDHAWGGNHFLMGGAIKGRKIHGQYPDDLTDDGPLNIGRGRLIPTTPWEGVWKGVAEWFGVESENMADVLPNLDKFQSNIFGKTDLYK